MKTTFIVLSALASSAPLSGQENQIERVTVTGDFRQVTLDQLSASASVLDATRLQSRQADHLDSILNLAPNVNFASGASRGRFIQIRGIGERSQFAEPINPSVSFLIDDFDFSGLAAAGLLFDNQQVEVYRGPQATLFGTGALAGAVKIVSTAPTSEPQGYGEVRIAKQNTYRFEGGAGRALSDNIQLRGAFLHNQSDGFVTNTYLDEASNDLNETAARLALNWQPGTASELALSYRWYDIDNGYDAFSLDNDRNTRSDEPGFDEHQTHAVSANFSHQFAPGELRIIATHASHNIAYGYDEDWTYSGFHPWGYTSFDAYYREVDTQTLEARFSSSESARLFAGSTSWVIGAHLKSSDETLLRQYTYADSDFSSNYSPTTTAVYAQTQTQLTPVLSLVVGLRAENYGFDYRDNRGLNNGDDTDMLGGKLALQYTSGEHFWYASVSRGYKGAGINPDERVSEEKRFFDAEYNWNYELGVKGPLFNDALMARAAIFYMDRENTQVADFDLHEREDAPVGFIDIIGNADVGTNQGVELELSWQPSDAWLVQSSIGYLDASFEGYQTADGNFVEKQRQAQSPEYTANLFSEWQMTDSWLWRLDMDYKDDYRFSDGHDVTSPATTLVNSELVWLQLAWETSLWVKNVFDRTYYIRGFGGFSNDPRDYYEFNEPYYQLGDGRQFGVTVRYQF
ncbi:TonB-dependent receptor [Alteromonas aestuariivivens]|uniref:TonB-dependent receptor n=1 Tax=Alteromonas aestuariivivens TaxID=1938339 RepID=A0A3D8M6E4_9ALTE|nr:TonB-dependent receptor [Alteromonas aestuariivivens]RDV25140.1 TonB-dependent receptor [Alteromonas aestuariivivens]